MKIDIFPHFLPDKYAKALVDTATNRGTSKNIPGFILACTPLVNLEARLRLLDRYEDVKDVINTGLPELDDTLVTPEDAAELARIANDSIAEVITKNSDKFVAGVACLPLNDIDAALKEAERAITQLRLKGIQIFTKINGEAITEKKFWPLYEMMANYDLPIWIHPIGGGVGPSGNMLGWPFDTSVTMVSLALSGIFDAYPRIKFITHHCGAMIPYFERRVWWSMGSTEKGGIVAREHLHKFYNDTAVYGSTPALMCAYSFFGAEHMLFGTDMPLGPFPGLTQETIRSIEHMQIPDTDKEKIFETNAITLMNLPL